MSQDLTYRNDPKFYRADLKLCGDLCATVIGSFFTLVLAAVLASSPLPFAKRIAGVAVLLTVGSLLSRGALRHGRTSARAALTEYWRRNVTGYELVLMLQRENGEMVMETDIQHRLARQFRHTPELHLLTIPLGGWFAKPRVRTPDMNAHSPFSVSRVQWRDANVDRVTLSDPDGDSLTLSAVNALEALSVLRTRECLSELMPCYRSILDDKTAISRSFEAEASELREKVGLERITIRTLRRHRRDLAELYLQAERTHGVALDYIQHTSRMKNNDEGRELRRMIELRADDLRRTEERLFPESKVVINGYRNDSLVD